MGSLHKSILATQTSDHGMSLPIRDHKSAQVSWFFTLNNFCISFSFFFDVFRYKCFQFLGKTKKGKKS